MVVVLSRIINEEKCYYGTYDLSDIYETRAFTNAVWRFGEYGDAVVVEREKDGEKS